MEKLQVNLTTFIFILFFCKLLLRRVMLLYYADDNANYLSLAYCIPRIKFSATAGLRERAYLVDKHACASLKALVISFVDDKSKLNQAIISVNSRKSGRKR